VPGPHGLLVVDKPAGLTSHDVVARCRRICGTRRVGHAGTLDPMATGVLLVGVGVATRLLGRLALADKAYDATARFGQTTLTDDAEGECLEETDAGDVTEAVIEHALLPFRGTIDQVPSAVSAIKVDGQRAYARVRAGEQVQLKARRVVVSELALGDVRRHGHLVDADLHVVCSTGTYIRALARDVGAALGVGGHLTRLRRTRVGPFGISRATPLDDLDPERDLLPLDDVARRCFPSVPLDETDAGRVRSGRPLDLDLGHAGPVAVFGPEGAFLALYEQHGPVAKPMAVFG
jgi:tRNA pseudouridine55 synthase